MSKVSVVSFSYRGVTDKLVQALAQGISEGGGEASYKLASDVFVLASGQPFGVISGHMKTFLESCWISPERERLQGKPFTYIVNGSSDPKDSGAYLEKLAGYFRWPMGAGGILTTASGIDGALDQARQLGVALAKLQK